jgi:hypothetical protein
MTAITTQTLDTPKTLTRSPLASGPWPEILDQCRTIARASAVIAVDAEGLVVASVGTLDKVQVTRIAAHVARAFDLLDRLKYVGRLTECLCARYTPEGEWLTAVRVAPNVSTVVTIVMIGPYTLVEKGRTRLRNTFLRLIEETKK